MEIVRAGRFLLSAIAVVILAMPAAHASDEQAPSDGSGGVGAESILGSARLDYGLSSSEAEAAADAHAGGSQLAGTASGSGLADDESTAALLGGYGQASVRVHVSMQRLTDSRIEAAVRARAADIEVSRELAFAASDVVEAASLGSGPLATAEPGPPTSKRPQPEPMISTADKSAASSPENAKGVVLLAGAVAAAGVAAVAAPSPASLRWLRGLVGLSLFTRLRRDDVLNHPRRNEIYEFVRQNPGERLEVARRVTGLSTGVFLHHISILERQDVVRVHRIEGATRLYLAGPRVQPAPYVPRVRRLMLAQLGTTPGLSQGELASAFGMSARAVSYHISWLHRHSLVDVRRDGRLKRCFALETPRTP